MDGISLGRERTQPADGMNGAADRNIYRRFCACRDVIAVFFFFNQYLAAVEDEPGANLFFHNSLYLQMISVRYMPFMVSAIRFRSRSTPITRTRTC